MKGLIFSLLLASSPPLPAVSPSIHSSNWSLSGELASECVLATVGDVFDARGVQVTIQCESDAALTGNVVLKLSAAAMRDKRLTMTADVQQDVQNAATLWIKSSRNARTLSFETDSEDRMLTAAEPNDQRSITSVVSGDADMISLGVMLQQHGVVTLRNVRLHISSDGDMSPRARQVLDSALDVIRQHRVRGDTEWQALATHAQQLAAGAQESADIYPVIRHVLQTLGDKQSLVLTPEASQMLNQHRSQPKSASVQFFSLPDGAELVLMNSPKVDRRVADNWP